MTIYRLVFCLIVIISLMINLISSAPIKGSTSRDEDERKPSEAYQNAMSIIRFVPEILLNVSVNLLHGVVAYAAMQSANQQQG